jgi:hypothetical protein
MDFRLDDMYTVTIDAPASSSTSDTTNNESSQNTTIGDDEFCVNLMLVGGQQTKVHCAAPLCYVVKL